MRRRIFTLAAALSLLLCVAACAICVRSYLVADEFSFQRVKYVRLPRAAAQEADGQEPDADQGQERREYRADIITDSLSFTRGVIRVYRKRSANLTLGEINVKEWSETWPPGNRWRWDRLPPFTQFGHFEIQREYEFILLEQGDFFWGFCFIPGLASGFIQFTGAEIDAPAWSVALLTAALPFAWGFRQLRSSRRVKKGHCMTCGYSLTGNTSGFCPECGAKAGGSA